MTQKLLSDIIRDFVLDAENESDLRGYSDTEKDKAVELCSTVFGKVLATITNVFQDYGVKSIEESEQDIEKGKALEYCISSYINNLPSTIESVSYITSLALHFGKEKSQEMLNNIVSSYYNKDISEDDKNTLEYRLMSEVLNTSLITPLYIKEGVLSKDGILRALKYITNYIKDNVEEGERKFQ